MPSNLSSVRACRMEIAVLRTRICTLVGECNAEWGQLSDLDQQLRLQAAEPLSQALRVAEAQLDVELDRLLDECARPRIVAMAKHWAGDVVQKQDGVVTVVSLMPQHVLDHHVVLLKDELARATDTADMEALPTKIDIATEEQSARLIGAPSPKATLPRDRLPPAPVQHRGEALALMTGGIAASGGSSYEVAGPGRFTGGMDFAHQPGIGLARLAKLAAVSRGSVLEARHWAAQMYPGDTRIFAALQQNVGTAGGFLVPEEQAREMVTLLRSRTVVRPNARTVPIAGTMVMPVQTSGVAATWLGESVDDLAQDMTFGQRRLTARKLRALIAASNDLIRNSSPEADTFIRDELVAALASAEDLAFIRGVGTGNEPKGLRYWALAANVNNGSGSSAAQIEADLIGMVSRFAAGMKANLTSPRWLMASRPFFKLYQLRDTVGALVFPEIREAAPRLLGFPVSMTDLIPVNLSPGTVTEIYLADFSNVILGENLAISVAVSDVASYKDSGGAMQSTFSRDETAIRAIMSVDMIVARDEAVQVLTGAAVTW